MRASLAAAALFPAYALATLSITSPSSSEFWVFNASNSVNWTSSGGDPSSFDIGIINTQNTTGLTGVFSIAQSVPNNLSFTVTNVTLTPGDNYILQFFNSSNTTQVLANSSSFTVKPNGTTPAPPVGSSSASGSSGSATGGASGSGTSSSTASGSSPSASGNSASTLLTTKSAVVAAGAMAVAALAL
jgi:hypothetical protein